MMATAPTPAPVPQEEILPADLARMALEATDNVISAATDWAVEWMNRHQAWEAQHFDAMRRMWIADAIGKVPSRVRSTSTVTPFKADFQGALERNFSRMIESPIWGGKKIGDATPAEIRESAGKFGLQGRSMLVQERFQTAVADEAEKNGVSPNEPVKSGLSPQTFDRIWEQTNAA